MSNIKVATQERDADASPYERRHLNLTRREALTRTADRMSILRHLCVHAGASRNALTQALPIPKSTIQSRLRELIFEGWVQCRPPVANDTRRGRPAGRYYVCPERLILLGAEASGGRLTAVATTLVGDLVASEEVRFDPADTLAGLTHTLLRMHARVHTTHSRVLGIGVVLDDDALAALPTVKHGGLESACGDLLRGTSLSRVPVHLQRDVCAAALGEMEFGPGSTATPLLFLKVGHGFSACLLRKDESFSGDWSLSLEVAKTPRTARSCTEPGSSKLCLVASALRERASGSEHQIVDGQSAGQCLANIVSRSGVANAPMRIVISTPTDGEGLPNQQTAVLAAAERLSRELSLNAEVSLARFGASAVAMGAAALVRHRLARPETTQPIPQRPRNAQVNRPTTTSHLQGGAAALDQATRRHAEPAFHKG